MGNVVYPPSYRRSEVNPRGGRLFGGIPVTNRNVWCGTGTSSGTSLSTDLAWLSDTNLNGSYRSKHYLAYDCTGLRLVYANCGQDPGASAPIGAEAGPAGTWNAGTVLAGTITMAATLEYQNSAASGTQYYPVFFQGKLQPTLDPGAILVSDPVNIDCRIASHREILVRTWVSVPSGKYWPLHQQMCGVNSEGYVTNSDRTPIGSVNTSITASAQGMFCPLLILGITNPVNPPVLGVMGDSIITGNKTRNQNGVDKGVGFEADLTNDRSYVDWANGRAAPTLPLVKISKGSLRAQAEAAADTLFSSYYHSVRFGMLSGCTHVQVALGTNDIFNGRTAVQLQGDLTTICRMIRLRGQKPYLTTIVPRTTSSDNWLTATNQTLDANESVRVAMNAWIRGTAISSGIADGYIDVCRDVEVNASNVLTLDGGRWLTDGVNAKHITDDGVHMGYYGHATGGAVGSQQYLFIQSVSQWKGAA
jgi:lysophospholipase L1-like esterase